LILVLALLTIAVFLGAEIARRSFRLADDVLTRERAALGRWTEISCRRVLLPQAAALFAAEATPQEPAGGSPAGGTSTDGPASDDTTSDGTVPDAGERLRRRAFTLRINDFDVDLILADEHAKVDVNLLLRTDADPSSPARLRALAGGEAPTLRPIAPARLNRNGERKFESWDQLFQTAAGETDRLVGAAEKLSCWSGGRLNFRTASQAAFDAVCGDLLDEDERTRLREAIKGSPDAQLVELIGSAQLSERAAERLRGRLTERSTCYSLWIRRRSGLRTDFSFSVADLGRSGSSGVSAANTYRFRW
jgi:hypothetical protein